MVITESDSILFNDTYAKYGLIDREGREVLPIQYGWLSVIDSIHYLAERGQYAGQGIIKATGEVVVPFRYVNLQSLGEGYYYHDGGNPISGATVIDASGRTLLEARDYAMPSARFQYGLLHVRTGHYRKSGCVDINGNWVIESVYDMMYDFEEVGVR
jgi:hypothetical protein